MSKDINRQVKKTLAKNHACYVLITCDSPKEDGSMQVEMTYQGDPTIAAYLLQGAQSMIHEQEHNEDFPIESKIHALRSNSVL